MYNASIYTNGAIEKFWSPEPNVKSDKIPKYLKLEQFKLHTIFLPRTFKIYSSTLFSFLKPYFSCPDEFRWTLSGQIPFINLSNILLEAAGYMKHVKKVCPRPRPASLLSLPLDTAMLFTLLGNFEGPNFNILCKDGLTVTSNPTALKRENDVFGFIFNLDYIQSFCKSRKLNFIHRIIIRSGMTTCVPFGPHTEKTAASNTKPLSSKQSVKKITDEEKKILEVLNAEISMLNQELLEKKKNFSLEAKDKEIREMKNKRSILLDKEARKKLLMQLNRRKMRAVIDDRAPTTNHDLLSSFKDNTFTGTDYGLKTMSVTVSVSRQMFETHINLYNQANVGEQFMVPDLKPTYLQLSKPSKITAPDVNHLSTENNIGKEVAVSEGQKSILSLKIKQSNNISAKNYFVSSMKSRKELRSFYYSKNLNRKRGTLELRTDRAKDRLLSREGQFLLKDSKCVRLITAIRVQGTGVRSTIKGYDRRRGTWLRKNREPYATTVLTSEYIDSQLCIYYCNRILRPILSTSRCLNPDCLAFRRGRACSNRDVTSAAAIGLSAMTKLILNKDLSLYAKTLPSIMTVLFSLPLVTCKYTLSSGGAPGWLRRLCGLNTSGKVEIF
ncbi:hypothetical protein EDC94DRAFT_685421 [Helicostylum pulchrum]|nr:hypothetical protein EDC94DRAFT_685421 [Helicostylum pulchrum]